jgi:Flp pilus assembly protein TadG
MRRPFRRLAGDRRAASAVEFAIAAPILLALFFGILQFGLALQSRGALRSAIADVARNASVEFLNASTAPLSGEQIAGLVRSRVTSSPYLLRDDNLTVDVEQEETAAMAGTVEFEVTATYIVPLSLPFVTTATMPVTITKHIFMDDPTV